MAASWYFIYRHVSIWDQQEYTRAMTSWPIFHGLLTSDFGRFSMVNIFVIGRFLSCTNGGKLIFYQRLYLCETSSICFHANVHAWAGTRGQYLGHHNFCLISKRLVDGWILYLGYWFSVTHWPKTMYVGQWPIFHGPVILPYLGIWIIYLFLPILACWSLIWKYLWI